MPNKLDLLKLRLTQPASIAGAGAWLSFAKKIEEASTKTTRRKDREILPPSKMKMSEIPAASK